MSLQQWFRVGTHAWCNLFRVVPEKFETGMYEMKILGSEVLWCVFVTLVQDGLAHMRGVICSELFRQSSKQGCVR